MSMPTEYLQTRDRIKKANLTALIFAPFCIIISALLMSLLGKIGFIISIILVVSFVLYYLLRTKEIPKTGTLMMSDTEFLTLLPQSLKCENCGSALVGKSGLRFYEICPNCGNDNTQPTPP